MDWANEEYVRLYTRETADDLELSWEAVALWRAMLCKFDRSGVIPVRNGWPSIARMVRMPIDVVERAGPELVADGRVRVTKHGFVSPNFTEAQTASKSDKLRQRESRDRRREIALVKPTEIVEETDVRSRAVTSGHERVTERDEKSRDVTLPLLCSALPPAAEALPPAEEGAALPPLVNPDIKKKGRTKKPREEVDSGTSGDHARVRACWLAYWKRKTGMAPEWGGKQGKRLNEILAAHGASEVERRIALLEASGVRFHQGWDFMQFASMSDQLVAAAAVDGYDVRYGRARLPSPEEYEQEDDPFGERKPAVAS
jgi:hypothetical protein